MGKYLEMEFATELGKNHKLRVNDAKDDLTDAEVGTAMDLIIAKNIFTGMGGILTGKISARVVTTSTQDLNLV